MIKSAALKLSLYYLAIMMGMSIGFSLFLYHVSDHALNHGLRRPGFLNFGLVSPPDYEQFRQDRLGEARGELVFNLFVFNMIILVGGGLVSYALAQRTLKPIEDALEAQSRFAADASHELRTPLTAMQTEIEVALRRRDLTVAQAKELLESNLEEVGKLRNLSEGLLKLASQSDQALDCRELALKEVVSQAVSSLAKTAQAKNITIKNESGGKVYADRAALTEVLCVLLDNAIKYSPADTAVTVASHQDDDSSTITVTDQGRGIAADDLPHIFERFYRSDQSRSKQKVDGYGLGLSIAQKLVELHNGTISVDGTTGGGSTFSVKLPKAS